PGRIRSSIRCACRATSRTRPVCPHASRREDGERLLAAYGGCAGLPGVGLVDLPLRKPVEHFVQRHPALEAGERGAEAEVEPVAEAQVMTDLPVDVEPVAVGEAP